jgi:hypothetical protein
VHELDALEELIDNGLEHPRTVDLHGFDTCSLFIAEGLCDGVDSAVELPNDVVDQFGEVSNIVL